MNKGLTIVPIGHCTAPYLTLILGGRLGDIWPSHQGYIGDACVCVCVRVCNEILDFFFSSVNMNL